MDFHHKEMRIISSFRDCRRILQEKEQRKIIRLERSGSEQDINTLPVLERGSSKLQATSREHGVFQGLMCPFSMFGFVAFEKNCFISMEWKV